MDISLKKPLVRQKIINQIRIFFLEKNFQEIDLPILLQTTTNEPNIYSITANWSQSKNKLYLPIFPENSIKKLISRGIGNCFTLGKSFRDQEFTGPQHQPEFIMLEYYEMNKNYLDLINTTQDLILFLNDNRHSLVYQNTNLDLTPPWPIVTLSDLFKKYANLNQIPQEESQYNQIFLNQIEPNLPKNSPVFIIDYPISTSPLCLPCRHDPLLAERFELYIAGLEICNGNTENCNSKLVKNSEEKEIKFRQENNLPTYKLDQEFIDCLDKLPPSAGVGLGVERLSMLFANATTINEVLFFPIK